MVWTSECSLSHGDFLAPCPQLLPFTQGDSPPQLCSLVSLPVNSILLIKKCYLFTYFWLRWVSGAVHRLSLVVACGVLIAAAPLAADFMARRLQQSQL